MDQDAIGRMFSALHLVVYPCTNFYPSLTFIPVAPLLPTLTGKPLHKIGVFVILDVQPEQTVGRILSSVHWHKTTPCLTGIIFPEVNNGHHVLDSRKDLMQFFTLQTGLRGLEAMS